MDGMGHHLLADPGLSSQQYRGVGFTDLTDLHPQGDHSLAFPNDIRDTVLDGMLLFARLIHGLKGILQIQETFFRICRNLIQKILELLAIREDIVVDGAHQCAVFV